MSPPKTDYTIPVNDFTPEEALLRLQRDTDLKITCEVRNMDVRYLDVYPDCQYFVSVIIESGDRGRTITGSGMSRYFPAAKEFACDHLCDQLRAMGLELPRISIPSYRLLSPTVFEALKLVCEEQELPQPEYSLRSSGNNWACICIVGEMSKQAIGWHIDKDCARLKSAYKMMTMLKAQKFPCLDVNKNPVFKGFLYPTPIRNPNMFENCRIPYNRTLPSNYWKSVKTFKEKWGGIATTDTVSKVQANPWGSRVKQVARRHDWKAGSKKNESKPYYATNRDLKRFDQGVHESAHAEEYKHNGRKNNSNDISDHSDRGRKRRLDREERSTSTEMVVKSSKDFTRNWHWDGMDRHRHTDATNIKPSDDRYTNVSGGLPNSNNMDDQLDQSSVELKFEHLFDRRPKTSNPSSESSKDRPSGKFDDWKLEVPNQNQSHTSSSSRSSVDLKQDPIKNLDRGYNLFHHPSPPKSSSMPFKIMRYYQ